MKTFKKYLLLTALPLALFSCSSNDDDPVANNVNLQFNNTFKATTIVLGDASSASATTNTSTEGQAHHFSELKYVISNIRLVKADGTEFPYHINDLDNGATVIDQSKPETFNFVLSDIPTGEYTTIKFGLGVKSELNELDQTRFPNFYATAGANDTEMHWEWGTGYRFTKIEGFYDTDNKTLSVHTGSTIAEDADGNIIQGVDAYRDITLNLPSIANVGRNAPNITIQADFDHLLSGKTNTITIGEKNAVPSTHTANNMMLFVDNLGGDGASDRSGIFSISKVEN